MTALEQAVWRRDTLLDELITHSDAGSRYTAIRFTDRLVEIGARPSIGTVGDSYDNAMAESVNGLYKTELVWRQGPWRTAEQLELALCSTSNGSTRGASTPRLETSPRPSSKPRTTLHTNHQPSTINA